jgi:hypothetical protein
MGQARQGGSKLGCAFGLRSEMAKIKAETQIGMILLFMISFPTKDLNNKSQETTNENKKHRAKNRV